MFSCTTLYKLLFLSQLLFCKGGQFSCILAYLARTTDEVDHPWYIYYHGELLGILSSDFWVLTSMRRSPMGE